MGRVRAYLGVMRGIIAAASARRKGSPADLTLRTSSLRESPSRPSIVALAAGWGWYDCLPRGDLCWSLPPVRLGLKPRAHIPPTGHRGRHDQIRPVRDDEAERADQVGTPCTRIS